MEEPKKKKKKKKTENEEEGIYRNFERWTKTYFYILH